MSWRTTGILFVLAVLLGAGIWWSNRHEGEKKTAEEQAKKLFGEVEATQIDWIELRTSDGRDARLERKDGAWHVTKPLAFPADEATADGMASTLAGLTSEGTITDPQKPEVYGLADSAKVVRFGVGKDTHEVRIGKKTPIGANNYVATGKGSTVYTVASYRTSPLDKPFADVRERRPIRFDRQAVQRIEVTWPDGGTVVEKKGRKWHMVSPIDTPADDDTVDTLLSDLVFLRASAFDDEPPPDAEAGLDQPAYHVVLVDEAEKGKPALRHELSIGKALEKGNLRYARGAEPQLYEIPNERFEKLPKTVVAFRWKDLSKFVSTEAKRFELSFADPEAAKSGESGVVTITGEGGEDGWTTSPQAMGPGQASRLIGEVSRLKAADIAAEKMGPEELAGLGLSPARASLRVYGAKPKGGGDAPVLGQVSFGIEKNGQVFAQVPGRDTVYLVPGALAEHVPISLEAFRNRFVAKQAPAPAPTAAAGAPSGHP